MVSRTASSSKKFKRLFDGMSTGVQRAIIYDALIPLLDSTSNSGASKVLLKSKKIAKKYRTAPLLDLAAKKNEVNGILDELSKDAKSFFVTGRGKYETLIREVVESIVEWLNDIWITAFELGLEFPRMHSCLLFSLGVLDHVLAVKGGCHCTFSTIYVPVTIKDMSGKVIREFTGMGMSNIESAIMWIWRDVFISLLASSDRTGIKLIPELLTDIDDIAGWQALEQVVLGGTTWKEREKLNSKCPQAGNPVAEERSNCDSDSFVDVDDEDEVFYGSHWSEKHNRRVPKLRRMVYDRMKTIFKVAPSTKLFMSLLSLTADEDTQTELDEILASIASTSATSLSTAIEIYAKENKANEIVELLDEHAHLLRPRDSVQLQSAVCALATVPKYHERALEITEKELIDTARALHRAVLPSFSRVDDSEQRSEANELVKMRRGSAARQERVERWVDSATTPGVGLGNPMAFAAAMMGLPVPLAAADLDDGDHVGFIDIDPNEPDFAELREVYRPDIKSRFEGWTDAAEGLQGGPAVLEKAYKEILEIMPWMGAQDIVEEMIGRITDKPSKAYVCEALEAVAHFAKSQRKKASRKHPRSIGPPPLESDIINQIIDNLNIPFFPILGGIEDLD